MAEFNQPTESDQKGEPSEQVLETVKKRITVKFDKHAQDTYDLPLAVSSWEISAMLNNSGKPYIKYSALDKHGLDIDYDSRFDDDIERYAPAVYKESMKLWEKWKFYGTNPFDVEVSNSPDNSTNTAFNPTHIYHNTDTGTQMEFNQPTESEIIESFRSFAAENGIDLPDNVIADGKIHRFRLADEPKGKLSGAYKLYNNGRPAGFLQDFKSGFKENWKFTSENYRAPVLTSEQRAIQKQAFERQQQQFLLEQQQSYNNAAAQAQKEWNKTQTAIGHPYLSHKGVKIHHARINEYKGVQQLIIPLQNKEGKLMSLQRIKINGIKEDGSPNISKMNMADGKKSDSFSILNRQENPEIIAIAEGFATTASVIEDDFAVKNQIMGVMAVDADNLKSVANTMRELHPTATILVFADMGDHLNKGEHRAKAAAESIGGFAVLPPIEKGDMNDYLTGKAGKITVSLEQLVNSATNNLLAQSKIEKISNEDVDKISTPILSELGQKLYEQTPKKHNISYQSLHGFQLVLEDKLDSTALKVSLSEVQGDGKTIYLNVTKHNNKFDDLINGTLLKQVTVNFDGTKSGLNRAIESKLPTIYKEIGFEVRPSSKEEAVKNLTTEVDVTASHPDHRILDKSPFLRDDFFDYLSGWRPKEGFTVEKIALKDTHIFPSEKYVDHQIDIQYWENKIREGGQILPIIVDAQSEDGIYYIRDGIHRLVAAERCGLSHLPAVVAETEDKKLIRDFSAFSDSEKLLVQTLSVAINAELRKELVINNLASKLNTDEGITKAYLTEQANLAFGGSMAGGKHTFKDAYDLMEAAVNINLLNSEKPTSEFNAKTASEKVVELTQLVEKLPTQTVRDPEMDRMQQFSTPPALAFVANWVAHINDADTMLEPSAGTGDLAIWAKRAGAKVVLNELSDRRAETLKAVFPEAQIFRENAEQLHNVLPDEVQPTVIVMNPPFSTSVGVQSKNSTSNGAKHIEQALLRLADNGRLVAIVGQGMAADKSAFKEWWRDIQSKYNVRANIGIDEAFKKYGTSWSSQILVIDKNGATTKPVLTGKVESISELPTLLEDIKNERSSINLSQSESARVEPTSNGPAKTNQTELQPSLEPSNNSLDDMGSDGKSEHGNRNARIGNGQSGVNESAQQSEQEARAGNESADTFGQRGQTELRTEQRPDGMRDGASGHPSNEPDSRIDTGGIATEITDAVFANYTPQKLAINGAKSHPSKLVQSAAMASVEPPLPTYSPKLPPEVILDGLLSLAQLEAVVYAGQAHNEILPNGSRKGFFIGDGTGVGKGREISGVILDNVRQGRQKAVWVSFSKDLIKDAQRDLEGVGGDASLIQWHGKTKINDSIKGDSGIVFTSYSTLSAESKQQATEKGQVKGNSRLDQLVEWLGKDFDGVIAFDEAHSMGNAIAIKGKRGTTKPSKRALTGIALQKALPNARVVYVSATGATEINNLAYADRLGLWGEGTAFSDVTSFVNEVSSGGVAAMELVSRDMKSLGNYISRSLSFDGVTYQRMEHDLTPLQTEVYNELATAWQTVLQNINSALDKTEATGNNNAKGAALSAFWGAHQRFFNQVITSMQTPMVIDDIQKQLDSGNVAVIQIINTNEATQEREIAKAAENDVVLEELDFTPRQQLISYLENSFPVQQYHQVEDADGNKSFEPTLDSRGNPVFNKEAIKMRDDLIKTLEIIRVPDNPIDSIINHFGSDMVAEVTGRSRRFVHGKDEHGEFKVIEEKRGQGSSQADAKAFQDDKKKILLFSSAGGTGFSFHADNTAINQRKRYHYILQAGWRADSAVQGFGRTHRTNQKQPPHYVLPTTNLKAQKRFISSVARRLDQLGALTRGQRQTTSQGLLTASDNLESPYARLAIYTLFQDMYRERTVGLNFHEVTREMGLNLIDKQTGAIKDDKIPTTTQFLNRLLSLTTHRQDQVFEAFEERLVDAVDHAKQQGIFDEGVQVFRAKNIEKTSDTVVFTEPKSGAQTRVVGLEVTNDRKYTDWNAISAIQQSSIAKNEDGGFFVGLTGKLENKVFYLKDRHSLLNAEGKEVHRGTIYGISGQLTYIDNANEVLQGFKYGVVEGRYQQIPISQKITEAEAKERWAKELKVAPKTETEKMNILVGAILPIWDRINGKDYTIYRTQTDSGEQLLGRLLSEQQTKETLKNLGVASATAKMSNADLFANIQAGNKAILANGWAITTATVNNETRLEIRSQSKGSSFFTPANQKLLEEQGAFAERIQWQDRLFIPNNAAGLDVFTRITASKPVVDMIGDIIKLETAKSIEQTAPVNTTEPKADYPQTIEFTQVNSIRLNWSEQDYDAENKVFLSFNELQEFMRSEFKTESNIPIVGYSKHSLSIEMSSDNEDSITLTPRVDVSIANHDFNPFTKNLSEFLSEYYKQERETAEGGKFTAQIPIEPDLQVALPETEVEHKIMTPESEKAIETAEYNLGRQHNENRSYPLIDEHWSKTQRKDYEDGYAGRSYQLVTVTEPKVEHPMRSVDKESELRALWTEEGVSKERQDEVIAQISEMSKMTASDFFPASKPLKEREPTEAEPVKAWMMTSAEFSAIADAEQLINHGRKWEVFVGSQSFGYADSETATEAIKEAHENSVNNALYSRTSENSYMPVKEMPPAEVLAEYPQTVARFPELFPETVNQSESISKSVAPEGEKITVSTEAPLRVTKKLANTLTSILDSTGVDSSHEFITVHFSDPEYSPRRGGYHPVEISINNKDGKINYVTDYTYFGREPYVELVKDLDFDFENGRFQQLGMGDSREYYIKEGAGLFRTWQANFSHYHESGVFDIEVKTEKGIFKIQPEAEIVPISTLIEEPVIDHSSMPDYSDIPLHIPDNNDYFMPDIDYSTMPNYPAELIPQPAFESATPEPAPQSEPINSIENAAQIQVEPKQVEINIEPEMLAQKQNDVKTKIEVAEQPETLKKESAIKELIKEWQSRLPESEQKEKPASLQTTTSLSNDDRRIPPDVGAKYLQVENKFFHRKNPEIPVFEDKGAKIETKYNSQAVAADLVKIAKERGWETIKINGTNEFRRETWFEAHSRGLKTIGYTPTEFDKQLLAERLANAKTNSIEPATFADVKKPDAKVKLQKPDAEKAQTTPQPPKTPKQQQIEIEL